MKYKLIATDIDDTLLRKDKTLSPATKAALIQAQENGVIVAVASGRLPYGVRPYAQALDVFRGLQRRRDHEQPRRADRQELS